MTTPPRHHELHSEVLNPVGMGQLQQRWTESMLLLDDDMLENQGPSPRLVAFQSRNGWTAFPILDALNGYLSPREGESDSSPPPDPVSEVWSTRL